MNNNRLGFMLAAILALTGASPYSSGEVVFRKKEHIKRIKAERQIKPGRGREAIGYDPITKTWSKSK